MSSTSKLEQSNLLSNLAKMDKIPFKIFEMAISAIDIKQLSEDNVVYLSKQDIFAFIEDKDNDKQLSFKEVIEKMQKQTIFERQITSLIRTSPETFNGSLLMMDF